MDELFFVEDNQTDRMYYGNELSENENEKKKKATALFRRDKPHRQVTSEQYQFQAQDGTGIVIRRRRGQQDKRIYFSKLGE